MAQLLALTVLLPGALREAETLQLRVPLEVPEPASRELLGTELTEGQKLLLLLALALKEGQEAEELAEGVRLAEPEELPESLAEAAELWEALEELEAAAEALMLPEALGLPEELLESPGL